MPTPFSLKEFLINNVKILVKRPFSIIGLWRGYFKDYASLKKEIPLLSNKNTSLKVTDFLVLDKGDSSGSFGIYVYQDSWAFKHIANTRPASLVDIASSAYFVAFAAQVTKVISIDIRLLRAALPTIEPKRGDVTNLPLENNSVEAISTLSVIEHVGLGRYGDKLDINGMEKAAHELTRVLRPGGMLLVAFPVGQETEICFNAHRILTPEDSLLLFKDLRLVEERYALSNRIIDREEYDKIGRPYSYGCFRFTKD